MLNVVAIYGSPRKKSHSTYLLDKMLEGMKDYEVHIERIYSAQEGIGYCTGCDACSRTGKCVIKDSMQRIYKLLDEADIVITASPLYFYSVPANLKALIDRTQAVWSGKFVANNSMIERRKRTGYIICTAGEPEDKAVLGCAEKTLDLFQKCINAKAAGSILIADTDTKKIEDRHEVVKKAYDMGGELCRMQLND